MPRRPEDDRGPGRLEDLLVAGLHLDEEPRRSRSRTITAKRLRGAPLALTEPVDHRFLRGEGASWKPPSPFTARIPPPQAPRAPARARTRFASGARPRRAGGAPGRRGRSRPARGGSGGRGDPRTRAGTRRRAGSSPSRSLSIVGEGERQRETRTAAGAGRERIGVAPVALGPPSRDAQAAQSAASGGTRAPRRSRSADPLTSKRVPSGRGEILDAHRREARERRHRPGGKSRRNRSTAGRRPLHLDLRPLGAVGDPAGEAEGGREAVHGRAEPTPCHRSPADETTARRRRYRPCREGLCASPPASDGAPSTMLDPLTGSADVTSEKASGFRVITCSRTASRSKVTWGRRSDFVTNGHGGPREDPRYLNGLSSPSATDRRATLKSSPQIVGSRADEVADVLDEEDVRSWSCLSWSASWTREASRWQAPPVRICRAGIPARRSLSGVPLGRYVPFDRRQAERAGQEGGPSPRGGRLPEPGEEIMVHRRASPPPRSAPAEVGHGDPVVGGEGARPDADGAARALRGRDRGGGSISHTSSSTFRVRSRTSSSRAHLRRGGALAGGTEAEPRAGDASRDGAAGGAGLQGRDGIRSRGGILRRGSRHHPPPRRSGAGPLDGGHLPDGHATRSSRRPPRGGRRSRGRCGDAETAMLISRASEPPPGLRPIPGTSLSNIAVPVPHGQVADLAVPSPRAVQDGMAPSPSPAWTEARSGFHSGTGGSRGPPADEAGRKGTQSVHFPRKLCAL